MRLFCTKNPVLNIGYMIFKIQIQMIIKVGTAKPLHVYLKFKKSPNITGILNLKYVFIDFVA